MSDDFARRWQAARERISSLRLPFPYDGFPFCSQGRIDEHNRAIEAALKENRPFCFIQSRPK